MNKTTKKNVVVSSILSIALCGSIMTGATFALFTSESKVNVAISSGKVDVKATAENLTLYSPTAINLDGTVANTTNAATASAFKNGGTATITDGNVVTLDRMTPGDKATFDIVVTNESNVTVQYQTKIEAVDGYTLFSGLKVTLENTVYNGRTVYSNWATLDAFGEVERTTVTIELPKTAGNAYQDLTCKLAFTINAVQGNTVVENPDEDITYIYTATDLILFEKSVNNGGNGYSGKTVKLMDNVDLAGIEWNPVGQTGSTQFQGTFDGNGYTISNMTVNNPSESTNVSSGFFGWLENTSGVVVNNVKFKNANVTVSNNNFGAEPPVKFGNYPELVCYSESYGYIFASTPDYTVNEVVLH